MKWYDIKKQGYSYYLQTKMICHKSSFKHRDINTLQSFYIYIHCQIQHYVKLMSRSLVLSLGNIKPIHGQVLGNFCLMLNLFLISNPSFKMKWLSLYIHIDYTYNNEFDGTYWPNIYHLKKNLYLGKTYSK